MSRAATMLFLGIIAAGLLACRGDVDDEGFDAGSVEDFAPGSVTTIVYGEGRELGRGADGASPGVQDRPEDSIVFHLVHLEDGEFRALSAKDPHLGCTVPWRPEFQFEGQTGWFRNPCHGETYDITGRRVFGPSPRDLDRYPVEVRDGRVLVTLSADALILGEPGATSAPGATIAPTASVTEAPTTMPTTGAPIAWTLGEPVPLPLGVTLVLGTGCWQCGGQHSTFELFTTEGRAPLPKGDGEEHLGGVFDDPSQLWLAVCTNDCDTYTQTPTAPETVRYESSDRGLTWQAVDTSPTRYDLGGRLADGDLMVRHRLPLPVAGYQFPSGEAVAAPANASSGFLAQVLNGVPVWTTDQRTVIDADGAVVLDLSDVLPEHADIRVLVAGPDGAVAVSWLDEQTFGLTVVTADATRTYGVGGQPVESFRWLDADRLLAASSTRAPWWARWEPIRS